MLLLHEQEIQFHLFRSLTSLRLIYSFQRRNILLLNLSLKIILLIMRSLYNSVLDYSCYIEIKHFTFEHWSMTLSDIIFLVLVGSDVALL